MANEKVIVALAQNKYTPIVVGVLVIGGLAIVYFGGKALLSATGVIESKYDEELPKKNGFNPEYYKNNIGKVTISTAKAYEIAKRIHDSYGWATPSDAGYLSGFMAGLTGTQILSSNLGNDQEQLLQGAIQEAGSEYNLSKVSDLFQKEYKEGMIAYIKKFADNDDTKAISRIIKEYK